LFSGACQKVMMKGKHIPQFEAEVRSIEERWRAIPPACPVCGGEASLDLVTGDGDATTDTFECVNCGAESAELGLLFTEQPDEDYDPWNKHEEEYANRFN
jgi:Zn ribbon nucleic-acid-binding protein